MGMLYSGSLLIIIDKTEKTTCYIMKFQIKNRSFCLYWFYAVLSTSVFLHFLAQYLILHTRHIIPAHKQFSNIKQHNYSTEQIKLEDLLNISKFIESDRDFKSFSHNNSSSLNRNRHFEEVRNGLPFRTFKYPLDVDMVKLVEDIKVNGSTIHKPINVYHHNFIGNPKKKCNLQCPVFLVIMVKSAITDYEKRKAIRETWGNETILPSNTFKTIFVLGTSNIASIQEKIDKEIKIYNDVVQIDAVDTYYNNTLKTIGSMKWISEFCNNTKYAFLVDDDFYVATDLLVRYLLQLNRPKSLFMGRLRYTPKPQRGKFQKWKVSFSEYKYDRYPSFICAGAMIMSIDVVTDFNIAIPYTKLFRFDDVYLAIIAYKLSIQPQNNHRVRIIKSDNPKVNFEKILAHHGFRTVPKLRKAWKMHQYLETRS